MPSSEYEEISNIVADFIKHNRANDHSELFETIHNRFYVAFVVKRSKNKHLSKKQKHISKQIFKPNEMQAV